MKKRHLKFVFLLSALMLSTPSYADWQKMGMDGGETYYIDTDRIRSDDDLVYYWQLVDLDKPTKEGWKSRISYMRGNCKIFSVQPQGSTWSKEQMFSSSGNVFNQNFRAFYPTPNSLAERILKRVCDD